MEWGWGGVGRWTRKEPLGSGVRSCRVIVELSSQHQGRALPYCFQLGAADGLSRKPVPEAASLDKCGPLVQGE